MHERFPQCDCRSLIVVSAESLTCATMRCAAKELCVEDRSVECRPAFAVHHLTARATPSSTRSAPHRDTTSDGPSSMFFRVSFEHAGTVTGYGSPIPFDAKLQAHFISIIPTAMHMDPKMHSHYALCAPQ